MKRIVSIMLSAVFLTVLLSGCGSPSNSFEKQVRSGNYSKAIEIYNSKIEGNIGAENAAKSFLQDYLDESMKDYVEERITDQEYTDAYAAVERINNEVRIIAVPDSIYEQYLRFKKSKESYCEAVDYSNTGNLEEAIRAFSNVVPGDTANYNSAQDQLKEIIENYQRQTIETAKKMAEEGNALEAATCISNAEQIVGRTDELEDCMTDVRTQWYARTIDSAFDTGDHVAVIEAYMEAYDDSYAEISSDMTDKYSSSATNFYNDVSKRAEEAFGADKNYSAAIRVLQVAASEIVDDENLVEQIEQKIEYYQEYVPIYLTSLEYTQKAKYIGIGNSGNDARDVNGIQYEEDTIIYPESGFLLTQYATSDDEAYVLYNLNMKFSTLSGTVYRPYSSLSCINWGQTTFVKIFGDDVLLYEAPKITKDSYDALQFKIDVTGVRNLKIVIRGIWMLSESVLDFSYYPEVCMAEAVLQK